MLRPQNLSAQRGVCAARLAAPGRVDPERLSEIATDPAASASSDAATSPAAIRVEDGPERSGCFT